MAEHDPLTEIYNRSTFFDATKKMIDSHPDLTFSIIHFDIDNFRLYNTCFGEKEGDRLLKFMAGCVKKQTEKYSCSSYGRINADVFGMCIPDVPENMKSQQNNITETLQNFNLNFLIKACYGICVIDDRSLPIETLFSRAAMAAKKCKNSYELHSCVFSQKMEDDILREQEIANEMQWALDTEQFVVYLQPKYDLKTNRPYGAEAFVRWNHPTKGMISPGAFIPVFESNGFIGKLDFYMWEHTCRLIRKWIDRGMTVTPISVNMSRVDLYNPNIVKILIDLVKKYEIPTKYFNLELTESAFMDNPDIMKEVVSALHAAGFVIMMDDFGSGYSSLNTLKDIPVDILKIDMNFLSADSDNTRSERILASVIRMAGRLDLPVIVEGVETVEQKDYLQNVGCGFVQGFYFEKPMSISDYENLISNEKVVKPKASTDHIIKTSLWSSDSQVNYIWNCFPQPVSILEFEEDDMLILRANHAYTNTFGYGKSIKDTFNIFPDVLSAAKKVVKTRETVETDCLMTESDGKTMWYRVQVKYLGVSNGSPILFVTYFKLFEQSGSIKQMLAEARENSNKTENTKISKLGVQDIMMTVRYLKPIFDVVRIVDPSNTTILDFDENGTMHRQKEQCYNVWGKKARCENCTSMCALMEKTQHTKYEFNNGNIFYVVSRPIVIVIDNKEFGAVLEIVNHVTDRLVIDQTNGCLPTSRKASKWNGEKMENEIIEKLIQWKCDVPGKMKRLMDDEELYIKLLSELVKTPEFEELKVQLDKKNSTEAFNRAHSLKGVIGNLGVTPMYNTVCEIVEPLRKGSFSGTDANYEILMSQLAELREIIKQ